MSRSAILALNILIVSAYVAIALLASNPWIMFGGFLLLAVLIRCATLCWAGVNARSDATFSCKAAIGVVAFNLLFGLIFAAALLGVLYWLGQFWPAGVKIIVPVAGVFIAYKSTFPFFGRSKHENESFNQSLEPTPKVFASRHAGSCDKKVEG